MKDFETNEKNNENKTIENQQERIKKTEEMNKQNIESPKELNATKELDNDRRAEKEFRMKNNDHSYKNIFNRLQAYVAFFKQKLVKPSEVLQRQRNNHSHYGYVTNILATIMTAFIVTRLIESAIERYNFLAELSVLPIFTTTPNYLFVFVKLLVVFASFYFGMAFINFTLKKVMLKRQHVLKYWMTEYIGMNTVGLFILVLTFVLTLISPVGLFIVNVFLLAIHLLSFVVTFVASFYKTVNETTIDNIYLALMGLAIQLFISMGLIFILF